MNRRVAATAEVAWGAAQRVHATGSSWHISGSVRSTMACAVLSTLRSFAAADVACNLSGAGTHLRPASGPGGSCAGAVGRGGLRRFGVGAHVTLGGCSERPPKFCASLFWSTCCAPWRESPHRWLGDRPVDLRRVRRHLDPYNFRGLRERSSKRPRFESFRGSWTMCCTLQPVFRKRLRFLHEVRRG